MEFYSSGFSKVQQKQATKQYALSEPQEPFSGPSAYSFKIFSSNSTLRVDCKENMHGNWVLWGVWGFRLPSRRLVSELKDHVQCKDECETKG